MHYSEKMPAKNMLSVRNSKGIQRTSKQRLRNGSRERLSNRCRALSKENADLKNKLVEEKTKYINEKKLTVQLRQELAQTRAQLEKDNRLDEMDIHKPQKYNIQSTKYSDPTGDANQVRNNAKRKKKKTDLQEDYMEVEVSQIINTDKSGAELQVDKDRTKLLQDELEQMKASHNEITLRYETEVINARHQVDSLLRELEYGVQQYKRLQTDYEELLSHKDNFPAALHAEREKNRLLQEELQKTCLSYHEISQRYENDIITYGQQAYNAQLQLEEISVSQFEISQRYQTDVIAVRQQADTLQRELEKEVKAHADTVLVASHVINNLRAVLDTLCQNMAKEISVQPQEITGDARARREEKCEEEPMECEDESVEQQNCSLKSTDNAPAPELPRGRSSP